MVLRSLLEMLVEPKRAVCEIYRLLPYSFEKKLRWDAVPRPPYAYGVYHAVAQAKALGVASISVIEFGVAGGRGLIALERIAKAVTAELGGNVEIYGFDGLSGLPEPVDYRDMPYKWRKGHYRMDIGKVEERLTNAELIPGPVSETVPRFFEERKVSPVGFVAFDLDYYSSTTDALALFEAGPESFLPRVFCYFDNCIGSNLSLHSRYTGELLAVREFNQKHTDRKVARIHGFSYKRKIPTAWNEKMFAFHYFSHPDYSTYIGSKQDLKLPLDS